MTFDEIKIKITPEQERVLRLFYENWELAYQKYYEGKIKQLDIDALLEYGLIE